MKTRYSCIFGIMAILMLVSSIVVPGKLVNPSPVSADPGLMEWTIVDTPDSIKGSIDSVLSPIWGAGGLVPYTESGSEIIKLLVGSNGNTMYAQVRVGKYPFGPTAFPEEGGIIILKSMNGGRSWIPPVQGNLATAMGVTAASAIVWNIAIANDDANILAAAVSTKAAAGSWNGTAVLNQMVWISTDGGTTWANTNWPPTGVTRGTDLVSDMDISMDYGGSRDMMIGTRSGNAANTLNIQTMKIPSYGGWNIQNAAGAPASTGTFPTGDVLACRFSPTYVGDSTIVVVFSNATGTYITTGVHDLAVNKTDWNLAAPIELKNSTSAINTSIKIGTIINADLELPSDFSGQSASLRRMYVSTDAWGAAGLGDRGVYRVDDTIVYTLMDNTNTSGTENDFTVNTRRAHSIAYWGTYASGKLLVGESMGYACKAAVPTWFTDSPTVCPVPCWYPAKKPVSGAAGQINCLTNTYGYGNAFVVWSPTFADQGVAYAVTASSAWGKYIDPATSGFAWISSPTHTSEWPMGLLNYVMLDESAFSLTRNNGETWNELSMIDTRISKLTDVAPSADCSTIYLASVSNQTNCTGFDSVWRSSSNEKVVAPPLPALPIGQVWERVRVSLTALTCAPPQVNFAILRLAPDKQDGQIVFWAAGGTDGVGSNMHLNTSNQTVTTNAHTTFTVGANSQAVAWSPDFGDYWADITPRIPVQDMAAESSTALFINQSNGNLQKMPYTGTAWSNSIATMMFSGSGHTIEATGLGRVMGAAADNSATGATAVVSSDSGKTARGFTRMIGGDPASVGYHGIMDTDFETNATVYLASDLKKASISALTSGGSIYRNKWPDGTGQEWLDMLQTWTTHREYYGIVQTNSKNVSGQGTLYAAHAAYYWATETAEHTIGTYGGVERTLRPLDGIPKPGISWDCLDAAGFYRNQASTIEFTLEPKSLKICGCLTQDTNATLYAIDNAWYGGQNSSQGPNAITVSLGDIPLNTIRWSGMLWAYTDCVAKVGPKLTMDDNAIIGCDPATGRNQEVNFTWEQLCIATWYQLDVGKDKAMSMKIFGGVFTPASVTSPALVYLSGGEGTYPAMYDYVTNAGTTTNFRAQVPSLECGHTYYWRVRVVNETTNDWVRSPWSDVRGFTIKAGFKVTTPYYGPQLLAPDNGCGCACDAPVCFSWSPFKETVEYKLELSKNPDMSSPLVSTTTKTTAYQYTGKVDCNTNYFWRVMATKPAPSEWSATYSFMTQKAAAPAPEPAKPPETPLWVWVVIAIGTILVIVTLVLIFKTRRV